MKKINTILIVDDNKATLQLNKWFLADFFPSENIYLRSSCQEAINFITSQSELNSNPNFPLLILCDVYMPGMSGWDLVSFLKSAKEIDKEQIFTVLLSAYIHAEDAEVNCAGENVTCINKPLTDENIEFIKSTFDLAF